MGKIMQMDMIFRFQERKKAYVEQGTGKMTKKANFFLAVYTVLAMVFSRIVMYISYLNGKEGEETFLRSIRSFLDALNIWDAVWYRDMIETGYYIKPILSGINYSSTAFFPAMPYFYKIIHTVLGSDINTIYYWGSIINSFIFAMALFVSGKYIILTRKSQRQALVFITIMTFGVYSFYYSIFYTEAIFFFLLVLNFYFMYTRRYILAGVAAFFCAATRNLGVFLAFPMLIQFLMQYHESRVFREIEKQKENEKDTVGGRVAIWLQGACRHLFQEERFMLGLCLAPGGFFAYMIYLKLRFGDGFAFLHVQKAWFRGNTGIWDTIKGSISLEGSNLYYFCILFFMFLSIYMLLYKKKYNEFIFAAIYVFIPLSFGGMYSLARFLSAGLVFFLGFTDLLEKIDNKVITVFTLIALAMFEYHFIQLWCFGGGAILN